VDVARVDDLANRSSAEPGVLERGRNQVLVNLFKVDRSTGGIRLLTEGTDNESPLHLRSPRFHARAEEIVPVACRGVVDNVC
jgi:hypothetical protein